MMMAAVIIYTCACFIIFMARFYFTLPRAKLRASRPPKRDISGCCLAIFLGSGGHTSEALSLISALDFERYTPRKYIISDGDTLSAQKAIALELSKAPHITSDVAKGFTIIKIPRARNVHQSILATPPSALFSLLMSIYHLILSPSISDGSRNSFADALILNGPGTCVVLCIAIYIKKFFGLHAPKIIYVESFARVNKLSLSGIMLRPFVDRFIVQWPQLLQDRGRGECYDWLV